MSVAPPEAPTRPDALPTIDPGQLPDLDAVVPCQIDLLLLVPPGEHQLIDPCPCPATHLLTVSHGCTFTICPDHVERITLTRVQRMGVCRALGGCPECGRCGRPTCAGGERIDPLP